MDCAFDSDPAIGVCVKCKRPVCEACRRVFYSDTLCKVCTVKMYSRQCSLVKYEPEIKGS